MSQIKFSQHFPKYHPRSGEKTGFVEKILNVVKPGWRGYDESTLFSFFSKLNPGKPDDLIWKFLRSLDQRITDKKVTTIRSGDRWQKGKSFDPCVWSDIPYNSKVLQFSEPIEIVNIEGMEMAIKLAGRIPDEILIRIIDFMGYLKPYEFCASKIMNKISKNDGLNIQDFYNWFTLEPSFKKTHTFSGQVICIEDVEY